MSMTVTQLVLVIFALIAMLWGLVTLYKALKKHPNQGQETIEAHEITSQVNEENRIEGEIPTDAAMSSTVSPDVAGKDGLPILPRHQRPPLDTTFKAEITPDNPDGSVVLSADNTELELPESVNSSHSANPQVGDTVTFTKPTTTTYTIHPQDTPSQATYTSESSQEQDDAFSMLASATETITPVVHTFDENQLKKEAFVENSPLLDTHIQSQVAQEQDSPLNNAEQNINISIFPNQQFDRISGQDILTLVDKYGLKYGAMNMFHRYEHKDGTGMLWFSMMMITEDGVMPFDLIKLPNQTMKGLVLFLSLPHPKAVQGFDSMISVAGLMAHDLQATVYDETGEPLNKENTQYLREIAVQFGKNKK